MEELKMKLVIIWMWKEGNKLGKTSERNDIWMDFGRDTVFYMNIQEKEKWHK